MKVKQAYRFALDPTPAQERALRSHVGAARFAYNWGLEAVKAALAARRWERRLLGGPVSEAPWTLPALRRGWNQAKGRVAPWWPENSKEAYSSGLDSLARCLEAWARSRRGERRGARVGFPRPKRRGRSGESFRITTGSFGVFSRTRVQLPRIGHVRTHEPTTKLARRLEHGSARILAATISRQGDRWFCSFTCEVERADAPPREPEAVVGVDAGVRHLAVLSRPGAPRRLLGRAPPPAPLQVRLARRGGIEAPSFYPSSKTCSACGAVKAKLSLAERSFRCDRCGLSLDRDENAARNLAALAGMVAASGAETQKRAVANPDKTEPRSA